MNMLNHPCNPPPLLHVHIVLLPELTIPTLACSWCPPSAPGLILLATAHKRATTPEAYPNTPQTLMQQGHLLPASVCIEMVGTPATAKQSPPCRVSLFLSLEFVRNRSSTAEWLITEPRHADPMLTAHFDQAVCCRTV